MLKLIQTVGLMSWLGMILCIAIREVDLATAFGISCGASILFSIMIWETNN